MGSFLGILFCGGRGERLGKITEYISKAFVPVYDRPVFMYPLAQLEASKQIDEIVILTNQENDTKLRLTGYRTIVQDDLLVQDMFSGLAYIRQVTGDERPAVLMPCDNISDIVVDYIISLFLREKPDIAFSVREFESGVKLRQMGVLDPKTKTIEYKPLEPKSNLGVIAPYAVRRDLDLRGEEPDIFSRSTLAYERYEGAWTDIGDVISLTNAWKKCARKTSSQIEQ
jgi:dTDP-glucose pyrophosphorylase